MNSTVKRARLLAAVCVAVLSPWGSAAAQSQVAWTLLPVRAPITTAPFTLHVLGKIAAGWHIYSLTQPAGGPIATRINLPAGQSFLQAGVATAATAPRRMYDDAFKMDVELHEKSVSFRVPVRATSAANGADSVHVNVRYQICNASLCYPPQIQRLVTPVQVARK
ncbi:MAG: protein-disulfide reductase DsbD N-terminal domain-containing protein [Gemmatimonadota bacterium]|nr:protein-disulfide reductase DsbD N-terminal domain-containing protein [Gemmatimonadota bacterium]